MRRGNLPRNLGSLGEGLDLPACLLADVVVAGLWAVVAGVVPVGGVGR